MSKFDKMNRKEKRSARLLALQLLYANEVSSVEIDIFFDNFDNSFEFNTLDISKFGCGFIINLYSVFHQFFPVPVEYIQ